MKSWAKAVPTLVVVACAMILVAYAPAILVDPLVTAVAQIRGTTKTVPTVVPSGSEEIPYPAETSVLKKIK